MKTVRKLLGAAALAALLFCSTAQAAETCSKTSTRRQGELPSCLAFDGATANGSSAVIDTYGYRVLGLEAWAATTSTVEVNVLCRGYSSSLSGAQVDASFKKCATVITNPDNSTNEDHYVSLPRAFQYQITLTNYSAGTVYVSFERAQW